MAVTTTAAQLAAALRLGSTAEETAEAERLLAYATEAVVKHAPAAPDAVHNEAAIRLAGYLYDQPNAGRSVAYADALRNSGARAILLPYRVHRAGSTAEAAAPQAAASGLRLLGVELVAVLAPQTWTATTLPRPGGVLGGVSVDDGEVRLFRSAQLTGGGMAGSGTGLNRDFAVETDAAGRLLFAADRAGAFTIRIYG